MYLKINLYPRFSVISILVCVSISVYAQIPSLPPDEESDVHFYGSGLLIKETKNASLSVSLFGTTRYLNQRGLEDSYTFADGNIISLDKRNDVQFQKVMLYFKGWLYNPKFRYLFYAWTSNTNLGLGAQVVVGGNFQYEIKPYLDVGVGIGGLPSSRAMYGQWPGWLRQDARPMAEEFFRASFTTGIWAQGAITDNIFYKTMLGNNLSQLGVDAGQLDNDFDSFSAALWWTTGNFGRYAPYGDYEHHESLATMLGAAYTRSNETPQSQPGTEDPENSQIRLSDGRTIFNRGVFGPDVQVTKATYQMNSINGSVKYQGFSASAEYYLRWVSNFRTNNNAPVDHLFDSGFYLKSSYMLVKKTLMGYAFGSKIFGEYGDPYELGLGVNWYAFKDKSFRINTELIHVDNSPVGYFSYPMVVGAQGVIFMLNLELFY
ncbi:hypothetical protein WJR50_26075 [Catalinimonas sp. 4WD22]|uniref:hypothetical protein n=1 Tax=Catalinimonas locisalis TaxID=3133978 RepID=UPI0031011997